MYPLLTSIDLVIMKTCPNVSMSLFPDEDVLTKEIEAWRGFIDKLPSKEDKAVLTKLLNSCYKYSLAINCHV